MGLRPARWCGLQWTPGQARTRAAGEAGCCGGRRLRGFFFFSDGAEALPVAVVWRVLAASTGVRRRGVVAGSRAEGAVAGSELARWCGLQWRESSGLQG
ncbi:hypothetical protein ACJRO7_021615 [Eucalyptus globulus]|uniref:Uncharacterized protein n=1 Tax=Eucalyptus globulus TaxID=34317 RepID=A0ABD3KMX6_EUCGL